MIQVTPPFVSLALTHSARSSLPAQFSTQSGSILKSQFQLHISSQL